MTKKISTLAFVLALGILFMVSGTPASAQSLAGTNCQTVGQVIKDVDVYVECVKAPGEVQATWKLTDKLPDASSSNSTSSTKSKQGAVVTAKPGKAFTYKSDLITVNIGKFAWQPSLYRYFAKVTATLNSKAFFPKDSTIEYSFSNAYGDVCFNYFGMDPANSHSKSVWGFLYMMKTDMDPCWAGTNTYYTAKFSYSSSRGSSVRADDSFTIRVRPR